MKTDSIFYQLFAEFPSIFFELIGRSPNETQGYQFRSVEIKQTAFRIDGVFLPSEDNPDKTVYFCEVQFQKDELLYHRLFAELFLFLDQNPSTYDWYAVILYPTRSLEPDETRLYQVLLQSSKVQRVYLDELESAADKSLGIGVVKLVVEPPENAVNRARQLIDQARQEIADRLSSQAIIDLIETIVVYKFPQLSRQEVENMLKLSSAIRHTRVYQEALEEGREEGRTEGLKEGRTEGLKEGKLAAVPLLLKAGLTVEQIAEQLEIEIEAVKQIAQQQS
ncbi:MAG: Rpn family recombination-promoting nuclease/putative transposase [Scytonema sp. RU_4_4]|nr:Rpn family recombination-promoting nuclease/putative transposase [Scytonema sp. RU_4_4]